MPKEEKQEDNIQNDNIQIGKAEWNALVEKLKMLEEVADKGRVLNYQMKQTPTKRPLTVKVSEYNGKYIVGWKTLKEEYKRSPTTGRVVWGGETLDYEIFLMDKDGNESKEVVVGYNAFSDAHYDNRIECPVVSKKEMSDGKMLFEIQLPGGKNVFLEQYALN